MKRSFRSPVIAPAAILLAGCVQRPNGPPPANKATTRSDGVAQRDDSSSRALLAGAGSAAERDGDLSIVPVGFGTSERITKTVSVAYDASGHVGSCGLNEVRR